MSTSTKPVLKLDFSSTSEFSVSSNSYKVGELQLLQQEIAHPLADAVYYGPDSGLETASFQLVRCLDSEGQPGLKGFAAVNGELVQLSLLSQKPADAQDHCVAIGKVHAPPVVDNMLPGMVEDEDEQEQEQEPPRFEAQPGLWTLLLAYLPEGKLQLEV